jgi:hypothetical protein
VRLLIPLLYEGLSLSWFSYLSTSYVLHYRTIVNYILEGIWNGRGLLKGLESSDWGSPSHGYEASLLTTTSWVPGTHSIAAGHSEQKHHLLTAGLEPRQSWQWYNSVAGMFGLSTSKWTEVSGSNVCQKSCHPGRIYFVTLHSFFWQKQEQFLKTGHNHFHTCLQLAVHSPTTGLSYTTCS